jgi:hypothetical protein
MAGGKESPKATIVEVLHQYPFYARLLIAW